MTTTQTQTKTAIVKQDLVWQYDGIGCCELLKALTGTECVPCEGGIGFALHGSLDFYEEESGKGYTAVYSWKNDWKQETAVVWYSIYRNETWDQPDAEAEHPTLEDRCIELLRRSYEGFANAAPMHKEDLYREYNERVRFVAELLGVDHCELAGHVRDTYFGS